MNHLEDDDPPHRERELTLSTGAILGIFLGLVVLCGGFFGFGYNMGRKSAPTPLALTDVNPPSPATDDASIAEAKPSPSTPVVVPSTTSTPAVPKAARHTTPPPAAEDHSAGADEDSTSRHSVKAAPETDTPVRKESAPIVRQAVTPPVVAAPTAGGGSYIVQVAAVSHQEDATLLVGALRARGYTVSAHPVAGDSFIHVQVGPFRDKKEAEAMRQRLITDGYNAIVK